MKSLKTIGEIMFKKDHSYTERLEKNKVRVAIERLCREYLHDPDDILVFEALPKAIDSTIAVIEEDILTSKYDIVQQSETLFEVRLKELIL